MKTNEKEVVFVGVDVSKDTLDVYFPDTDENINLQNTEVDINSLCKELKKKKNVLVAMEATGGYETLLVKLLAKHEIDAAILNPRQVRDFAKGIGLDAKTDPIEPMGNIRKARDALYGMDQRAA